MLPPQYIKKNGNLQFGRELLQCCNIKVLKRNTDVVIISEANI